MRSVRVAVVSPRFPPDIGGLENYARRMADALADRGHQVMVITSHPGKGELVEQSDGITVHRLGTTLTLSNTPINPLWYFRVRRLFKRYQIDAVCTHSPVPYLADVATYAAGRRPVVATYHAGSMVKGVGGPIDAVLKFYERAVLPRVLARAKRLIGVSPVALTARSGRHTIITPGVDTVTFHPSTAPREPVVLFAGRVESTSRWKGLHVLIAALPRLRENVANFRLEIVGDGDLVPELKQQAAELGVADLIDWRGRLSQAELAERMRQVAVTCLPSLTESESFGMALVEAMSSGCPVVGARSGGIGFVIRDGVDGLLVPPGDSSALADALTRVLIDPEFARRLGAQGRKAAEEKWDWSVLTERMADEVEMAADMR